MQFYDATNKRAICQKIDRLCDSDDTSYPRLEKTAEVNDAGEKVAGWLINADGTWEWDDSNYTDLPIGTQTLIEGQGQYTFNDKFLQILEVQVKDDAGNFRIIPTIDQKEVASDIPLSRTYETAGFPQWYDKVTDDTIIFYPAPTATDVTLASGLKIRFKRTLKLFTAVATTAEDTTIPGFASPFHEILSYMAAIPFCMSYKKDRVGLYEKRVAEIQKELIDHYSSRERDIRHGFTMAGINYR